MPRQSNNPGLTCNSKTRWADEPLLFSAKTRRTKAWKHKARPGKAHGYQTKSQVH